MCVLGFSKKSGYTESPPYIRQRCPDDSPGRHEESGHTCGRTNEKMTRFINCNSAFAHRGMHNTCHKHTGTTQLSIAFTQSWADPVSWKPPERLLDPPENKPNLKYIISADLKVSRICPSLDIGQKTNKQNNTAPNLHYWSSPLNVSLTIYMTN